MPHSTLKSSAVMFRYVAIGVLFLTSSACALLVIGALNHTDNSVPIPTLYAPAVLALIGGVAMATLLEGVARLLSAPTAGGVDPTPAINRLLVAVNELKAMLPSLMIQSAQLPAAPPAPVPEFAEVPGDPNIALQLERMVKLLEEMKEVSMLDETQRQTRRMQSQARRKTSRLEEASRFTINQNWQQADALLHLLESLHPGDEQVLACRNQLDDARIAAQAESWDRLRGEVNDLMALSKYSEAVTATMQFLEKFPAHTEAQQLVFRIRQEQTIYTENASSRLYEEVKSNVENRKWRSALDGIQIFLERFPEHPRAFKIRQQIRVIQKNAEIEERHEQEDRIRELINGRQFSEAADLSEDLLQRFPDSPQAAYLTELLPKLRERSVVGEEDAVSP